MENTFLASIQTLQHEIFIVQWENYRPIVVHAENASEALARSVPNLVGNLIAQFQEQEKHWRRIWHYAKRRIVAGKSRLSPGVGQGRGGSHRRAGTSREAPPGAGHVATNTCRRD